MIKTRKQLKFYIEEDTNVNLLGKKISCIEYFIKKKIGQGNILACDYLKCLREYEYSINCRKGLLRKIFVTIYHIKWLHKSYKYGIWIAPNTCSYGLKLLHFSQGGVTINCKKMGCYCSANSGVLIGNKDNQDNTATIGDHVSFGPGVKVIGKVNIGDNVLVAANAVVVKDIPENCIAGGIPAKVIKTRE